ncbi:hypothetical protein C4M75_16400 [Escherichia coli]|uniref:Uncharacterized protein n=4 Tax=Escherichia coli TaxID=562 RepID=A0A0A2RM64_ECOLX|nr:hypothetical protein SY51_19665 [Escherichia coli]ALH92673.1 hypothetical protein AO055_21510 [Escherichia coli O157:H7]AMQ53243.1 hypothetical protein AX202_19825 [Escherichia coli JJ1887]AQX98714.1 hypothetical protein B0908_19710 [Escherichia coli NU14]ASE48313.1 hypothetical protein CEP72_15030 [Escherichia coli O157]ATI06876.1 hypothetical protein CO715_14835 [Escherichia coli M12]AXF91802.1 hypothetical protein APECO2_24995 [Escherichia coli APEC O2-211]AXY46497.1 hypothetical prote
MSRDQEDPRGEPESTTLLTLLPVLLSQPGAGFFFDLSFSIYPREVLVFVMRTPVGTTSALR